MMNATLTSFDHENAMISDEQPWREKKSISQSQSTAQRVMSTGSSKLVTFARQQFDKNCSFFSSFSSSTAINLAHYSSAALLTWKRACEKFISLAHCCIFI
jgi:hypothetical protein